MLTSYLLLINAFLAILCVKEEYWIFNRLFLRHHQRERQIFLSWLVNGRGDMAKIAGIQISRTMYTVIVMPLLIKIVFYLFS